MNASIPFVTDAVGRLSCVTKVMVGGEKSLAISVASRVIPAGARFGKADDTVREKCAHMHPRNLCIIRFWREEPWRGFPVP